MENRKDRTGEKEYCNYCNAYYTRGRVPHSLTPRHVEAVNSELRRLMVYVHPVNVEFLYFFSYKNAHQKNYFFFIQINGTIKYCLNSIQIFNSYRSITDFITCSPLFFDMSACSNHVWWWCNSGVVPSWCIHSLHSSVQLLSRQCTGSVMVVGW